MTISRVLGWLSALSRAFLALAFLAVASIVWADNPRGSCERCQSAALEAVDWTAIYLGDFATGCALINPYEQLGCPVDCPPITPATPSWRTAASILGYDPFMIFPSPVAECGFRVDGNAACVTVPCPSGDSPALGAQRPCSTEQSECPSCEHSALCFPWERPCCTCAKAVQSKGTAMPFGPPTAKQEPAAMGPLPLAPGEATREILELVRRLGPRPCEGTMFDDEYPIVGVPIPGHPRCFQALRSEDSLARALRSLEAQDAHRRGEMTIEAMFEDSLEEPPHHAVPVLDRNGAIHLPCESLQRSSEQIDTLRQAGRMLEEAANMLEEHGLYDRADELRGSAQQLRQDARDVKERFLDRTGKNDPNQPLFLGGVEVNR